VMAGPSDDPALIRDNLITQVTGRVRWRESVMWMAQNDVTEAWEVGAGKALSGMVKRIAREMETKAIGTAADIAALKG
jgi:[acyl-carrier-protein] S-malonyltransferase